MKTNTDLMLDSRRNFHYLKVYGYELRKGLQVLSNELLDFTWWNNFSLEGQEETKKSGAAILIH